MKFPHPYQALSQLMDEYPHVVQVNSQLSPAPIHTWLCSEVGAPYVCWINEHPEYWFKREADATWFSLTWS